MILVTGSNGFVGRALASHLEQGGQNVRRVARSSGVPGVVEIGEIGPGTNWSNALSGCEAVVHLAARVHMIRVDVSDPAGAYRDVNTTGTLQLARQAAEAGVRRFVYLSTTKVHGESGAISASDTPDPGDPYALSKLEAEIGLREISRDTGMELVILRPPLVYGPGVRANFLSLVRAVERGIPLPLGSVENRRSLIFVGNLVDAIRECLLNRDAGGKIYLVSDGEDVSTPQLIRRIAASLGRRCHLVPVPILLIKAAGMLIGRTAAVERVIGSLTVDSSPIRRELNWSPPFSMQDGLKITAHWFLECGRR